LVLEKAPSKDGAFFYPRFSPPPFPLRLLSFHSCSAVVLCKLAADVDVHFSAASCPFNPISAGSYRCGWWLAASAREGEALYRRCRNRAAGAEVLL
jgi:hypothetical protein